MHDIKLCIGFHCKVKGYSELLEEFERVLDIQLGEISKDGKFSLNTAGCIGSCRQALAVSIDGKMYRNVEVNDVKPLIESYR